MAKPIKKNGKWGVDVAATSTLEAGSGSEGGEYGYADGSYTKSPVRVTTTPASFREYDAATQASLETAAGRYGVPDVQAISRRQQALISDAGADPNVFADARVKHAAAASNAQWDEQAKSNEGMRGSALSMANTFAQSAAQTRARELGTGIGALPEDPRVTLKKKGAVQATSAKFRI